MNKPSVLFYSENPPANLFRLVQALPLVETQQVFVPAHDAPAVLESLTIADPAVVIIDSHYGFSDMQFLREMAGQERGAGPDAMRLRIAERRSIPASISLLQLVKAMRPKVKIIFVSHRKLSEVLEEILRGLGADMVIENTVKAISFTEALTTLITDATGLREQAKIAGRSARKFVESLRP